MPLRDVIPFLVILSSNHKEGMRTRDCYVAWARPSDAQNGVLAKSKLIREYRWLDAKRLVRFVPLEKLNFVYKQIVCSFVSLILLITVYNHSIKNSISNNLQTNPFNLTTKISTGILTLLN